MKLSTMKIQKGDVPVLLLSAIGGFLLVFFSVTGKNLGTAVFLGLVSFLRPINQPTFPQPDS